MNIIVGVIIESTLAVAAANEEREAKEKQKLDKVVMASLKAIFDEADTDKSGELDEEELQQAMKLRNVRDRLEMLDINCSDLQLLFGLLDEEGKGQISTNKFFRGCLRLRGVAMASDLHRLQVDVSRGINKATNLVEYTKESNEIITQVFKHLEVMDMEIIKGDEDIRDPVLQARRARTKKGRRTSSFRSTENEEASSHVASRASCSKGNRPSLVRASLKNSDDAGIWEHDLPEFSRKDRRSVSKQSRASSRSSVRAAGPGTQLGHGMGLLMS